MGILSDQAGEGPGDRTGSHRARHTEPVLSDAIAEQKQTPSSRNKDQRGPLPLSQQWPGALTKGWGQGLARQAVGVQPLLSEAGDNRTQ